MIKLESVDAFAAIAETGSITAAARRLAVSKSVVSERLAGLERILGAKLVHRTTRKLSLTEDGEAFYARAKQILRDVDSAASELAERRRTLAGPLRISTIHIAYPAHLRSSTKVRALTDWLQKSFGSPAYWEAASADRVD
jgi:molybdate transport repressor ModE-like protein